MIGLQPEADLLAVIESYRPELRASPAALDTVDFLLRTPPVPWPGKPGYWMLAAGAISTLPVWARELLGLFEILRGEQHGRAARGELSHRLPDLESRLRVKPRGRLVEKYDGRVADEAHRDI